MPPYAVIACSIVFFWSISVRSLIFAVLPGMAAGMDLSSSAAGLVVSLMALGYTAASWSAGWLPGRRKTRILAGVLLSIPAAILFALAPNYGLLLLSGVLLGVGLGVYLPLGLALMVEVGGSTGRKGYYLALHEASATFGTFGGSAVVALFLLWTDWRGAILVWTLVGVLAALAFGLGKDAGGDKTRHATGAPIPLDFRIVLSVFVYGAGVLIVTGLISVLPLIMVRAWGLGQSEAAVILGYTRLAGFAGVILVGMVADRWGHCRVLVGLQLLGAIGCITMSFGGFGLQFLLGTVVLAVGASGNIALLPAATAAAFEPAQRERAMAISNSMGGIIGMVGSPALFGMMMDAGYATGPILVSGVVALLAALATVRLYAHAKA
jgi:MFS family permease